MRLTIAILIAASCLGFSQSVLAQQDEPTPKASVAEIQNPISTSGVIELQDTIRASREQPKVMSIVPWQPPLDKAALPSPFVKRVEQDFMPLVREEFKRKVKYFDEHEK